MNELRPTVRFAWPAYARWLVPLWILVEVLSPGVHLVPLFTGLGLGAALMAWNIYGVRSARLLVRRGDLYHVRGGSERLIAKAGELRVVQVRVRGVAHPPWQIWTGRNEVVALVEQTWGAAELAGLARQLGAEVVTEPDPMSMRALASRYPGALPAYAKHPFALGAALAVGLMSALLLIDSV